MQQNERTNQLVTRFEKRGHFMQNAFFITFQPPFQGTVWWVIFVESQKRPSKLIFAILNFVSPGAWHYTSDDTV